MPNSQINHLSKKVDSLSRNFDVLSDDVSVLKSDVSVLKGDVSVLKGDVSVLKGDVSFLKGKVASLEKNVDNLNVVYTTLSADFKRMEQVVATKSDIDLILNRIDQFTHEVDVQKKKGTVNDYRLNQVEPKVDDHERRISGLEGLGSK